MADKILWLDLETTGLDPRRCGIIEAAWFETPLDRIPACFDPAIHHLAVSPVRGPAEGETLWEAPARAMHMANGLARAVLRPEVYRTFLAMSEDKDRPIYTSTGAPDLPTAPEAFDQVAATMTSGDTYYLAGNSIHFDRAFLAELAPLFLRKLSHRLLDIRSLMLVCKALGRPLAEPAKAHRAADDILQSFRWYQDAVQTGRFS